MNPYAERRNNPPMPYHEFERQSFQQFGRMFAIVVLASLIFAGIVYPWHSSWASYPFVVLFLLGAWLLAGRKK
jgi:hypothetical protein